MNPPTGLRRHRRAYRRHRGGRTEALGACRFVLRWGRRFGVLGGAGSYPSVWGRVGAATVAICSRCESTDEVATPQTGTGTVLTTLCWCVEHVAMTCQRSHERANALREIATVAE